MVEIKTKRIDELGVYYVISPIGVLSDKHEFCNTYETENDELALQDAIASFQIQGVLN